MIGRIRGTLASIGDGRAIIWACRDGDPGVAYEVLIPAASEAELAARVGGVVELETIEYLESVGQGSSFVPRLVGFSSPDQRALFDLLTKVKGLGNKRALRAMAAPTGEIASAIAAGDTAALARLPEIGKKLAETIALELRAKVGGLMAGGAAAGPVRGGASAGGDAAHAVAALVRLGETRASAEQLVSAALLAEPKPIGADQILAAALAHRG